MSSKHYYLKYKMHSKYYLKHKIYYTSISNQPYKEQLKSIKQDPNKIEFINNPSFKLCIEAIYIRPIIFYKIKRTHPNHKELLEFYRYLRI